MSSTVVALKGRMRGEGGRQDEPKGPDATDLRLAKFPLTDLGNAERFEARWKGKLLWCFELGWAWWDGRRWSFDNADAKVLNAVHATVRAIQDEARAIEGSDEDIVVVEATRTKPEVWLHQRVRDWGRSSENRARLNAVAEQARGKLSARPDQLDADPLRMTVLNGTLVFRRVRDVVAGQGLVELREHDPADLITKVAPVIYDPSAEAPQFERFLSTVQPEAGQRRFLAQWFGYNCTGLTSEQKLAFFFGEGSNGKSTLVDAVAGVLGEYSESIGIETFLDQGAKRKGSDASPDIAALKAIRMLRTSEPEKGAKLAEAFIKLITGGEPIRARFLNKEFFTLRPAFKLTISGNHRPENSATDHGYWRRFLLVPWNRIVADDEKDPELPQKLMAEASGILNWLLDGLEDWLESGLVVPDTISEATRAYREDSDPLGRFLSLAVQGVRGQRVQSSVLYALFCAWARWAGEREWSQKGFSKAMKDRGYRTKQSDVVWWVDMTLVKDLHDFQSGGPPSPENDDLPEERG